MSTAPRVCWATVRAQARHIAGSGGRPRPSLVHDVPGPSSSISPSDTTRPAERVTDVAKPSARQAPEIVLEPPEIAPNPEPPGSPLPATRSRSSNRRNRARSGRGNAWGRGKLPAATPRLKPGGRSPPYGGTDVPSACRVGSAHRCETWPASLRNARRTKGIDGSLPQPGSVLRSVLRVKVLDQGDFVTVLGYSGTGRPVPWRA